MGMKRINCSWDWVRNVMSVNPDYVQKVNGAIIRQSGDNAVLKALFQFEPSSVAIERAATIVRFGNRPVDTDAGDVLEFEGEQFDVVYSSKARTFARAFLSDFINDEEKLDEAVADYLETY
jgi:hypothetical protein